MAAVDAVESYVSGLPALRARRLAPGEWGFTIPGEELGGEPLDVGLCGGAFARGRREHGYAAFRRSLKAW